MNIYEIPEAYENAYMSAVDECTGEVDDAKLNEAIAAVEGEVDEKLRHLGEWLKDLEASAQDIGDELRILRARKDAKERKADTIRRYIAYALKASGRRKFETGSVAMRFRAAKRTEIIDANLIPPQYRRTKITVEPDKTAIAKAIDGGEDVPGAVRVSYDSLTVS